MILKVLFVIALCKTPLKPSPAEGSVLPVGVFNCFQVFAAVLLTSNI